MANNNTANDNPEDSSSATGENLFQVFISYRVDPDHTLAVALKELVEGAIDPSPLVFVSGAGGLRPSNIGFKPQIQAAVQSSNVFVAIITQHSKEREWIFFEAGAAWGRNQIYTPLLVDTSASDLASSIADYQAVRASNRDEVENLLSKIAEAVGGSVKSRFGNRYRAFDTRIKNYTELSDVEEPAVDPTPLRTAIELMKRGETEEAVRQFDELEESAKTNLEKAEIRISKIANSKLRHQEILQAVEVLEKDLGKTSYSQFFLGTNEYRPSAAIRHYENCLAIFEPDANERLRHSAIINISNEKYKIADYQGAYTGFREAILDKSRELRSMAANAWASLDHQPHALEKLILLSSALLDHPESLNILSHLTRLCRENGWNELALFFARRAGTRTGSSSNELGITYDAVNLFSLAYQAYQSASERGVSVAKVNMAKSSLSVPTPFVGLQLLRDHVGEFDAADAGYPHLVRSDIERLIQKEEQTASRYANYGETLFTALSNFGWEAARGSLDVDGYWRWEEATVLFANEGGEYSLKLSDKSISIEVVGRTLKFLAATDEGTIRLFARKADGDLIQLAAVLSDAGKPPITSTHSGVSESVLQLNPEHHDAPPSGNESGILSDLARTETPHTLSHPNAQ